MHFLQKYLKKYGKPFSLAVLFLTCEAVCDLLLPTLMSKIIDVGVAEQRMDYVLKMGGVMIGITAAAAVISLSRNVIASTVSQRFGTELRSDLFRKIQTFSFDNVDQFDRASLVTRLTNDVTQVQNFSNGLMRIFVKAPLLCIGGLIMATRLNPQLSVVLAVVVPVVGVLIVLNMKVGFPRFLNVQKALDKLNSIMREYLSGVRVVKAFNRFDFEVEKFDRTNREYQSRSVQAMRAMAFFNPGIILTVNLGIVAVVWYGGHRVMQGHMQVGHIIAFINYMTQILFSLMMISMVFNMFIRARASAGRIGEVLMQESGGQPHESGSRQDAEPGPANGSIAFENVSFSYEGTVGEPVLKNVTFSCLPGETVGIIGSTGSGKSTLVSLIPRFYNISSGRLLVGGVDVSGVDPKRLRSRIAIVPQKTVLFTGTVTDNVRWGKEDATPEEIETAAKIAEAHEYISSFPEKYDTRLGQGGVNFSGGQKQRLSIARAIVRKPDILILDDCTSAVDVATEARIKESLKTYAKDLTCLIIAQRITSVMDADKIVVLDRGEVVGIGPHDSLVENCRVYKEIFQSQIGKEMR
ncbi:ABC transporter ATP-binding protein [Paenibacillus thalictri]|uniref:ABC transporter ATP-binding protein n=1 Tax=Paenibacillus thalictri TaxID=2527873 RepID=A0A4V2J4Y5_9BACL|nr:ABC transporter ATP-binding protein [Paenibacillus thalictri]TBL81702.1 ABC transporter ATP-binding protein [Paenibacillus thalictri]